MSISAALVMLAQAGSLAAAAPVAPAARAPASATATVTASAQVLRPVAVRVDPHRRAIAVTHGENAAPQRSRDQLGTVWIEFS